MKRLIRLTIYRYKPGRGFYRGKDGLIGTKPVILEYLLYIGLLGELEDPSRIVADNLYSKVKVVCSKV